MEQLITWVTAHPAQSFVAYLVFMAAVQALPRPTAKSSPVYVWAYSFAHLLSANVKLAADPIKHSGLAIEPPKDDKVLPPAA